MTATIFLTLLFLILTFIVILGLIKPSLVVYWGSKSRKQVVLLYGLTAFLVLVSAVVLVDKKEIESPNKKELVQNGTFDTEASCGSITYEVTCIGENVIGVELFKAYTPSKIRISYSGEYFRMIESDGTEGNILADFSKNEALILDPESRNARQIKYRDLEDELKDQKMKDLMPTHFRALLEPQTETLTICGLSCKKYKVLKSGFVRTSGIAYVWVTDEITLKQMRYNFDPENRNVLTPLPLQIGIDRGTILKMEVTENNVTATYTATLINKEKPVDSLFELPDGYIIENK